MKVYVINMERSIKRRKSMERHLSSLGIDFELIKAIDGRLLSTEPGQDLIADKPPMGKTEIGCLLSHCKVYELMQHSADEFALVLEDDVLISEPDISTIFSLTAPAISKETVTLLTYFWKLDQKLPLRKISDTSYKSSNGMEYYICEPAHIEGVGRAGAYIISKDCAKRIFDLHHPNIRCRADEWESYDKQGAINGIQCIYPMLVTENPEHGSEIDYTRNKLQSIGKKIILWTIHHNIPVFAALLKKRRAFVSQRYKNAVLEN
jgi:glycosyl transferase family 25